MKIYFNDDQNYSKNIFPWNYLYFEKQVRESTVSDKQTYTLIMITLVIKMLTGKTMMILSLNENDDGDNDDDDDNERGETN